MCPALKEMDGVRPSGTNGVQTDYINRRAMDLNDEDILVKADRHIEVVTTETTGMKVKAQYLIQLFAATPEAQDPRRKKLIAHALDDLARLCQTKPA